MPLLSILLIPKTTVVQQAFIKEFSEIDLFKRAGFKSATDFEKRTVYSVGDKEIHVFGKVTGRAGQENKYELPPPIAETLFFGTVVLVAKVDDTPVSLTVAEWESMYEGLMGGFEDIGSEDTPETGETTLDAENEVVTRDGYVKDGFVVDDDDEDEDEKVSNKKQKKPLLRKPRVKTTTASKKKMTTDQVVASAVRAMTISSSSTTTVAGETTLVNSVLECANELTEEEYDV